MSLFDLMEDNHSGPYALSDHDLAVLADWAHKEQKETTNHDWKRAYAMIREGADLLLRRRARSSVDTKFIQPEPPPEPPPNIKVKKGA